jgi:hypothetical protein
MPHAIVRAALLAAVLAAAATDASAVTAAARARYTGDTPMRPDAPQETTSRFRFEGKDAAGGLTATRYCAVTSTCTVDLGAAVTYSIVLELDGEREEIASERCNGVTSTVIQGSCQNGALDVTLRLRTGLLEIKTRTDVLLGSPIGSGANRFEFFNDATKYWNTNPYWFDEVAKAYRFPAGRYRLFAPPLGKYCLPVQANPGVEFDLPAGGRTAVEIVYRGTDCLVQVATDADIAGLRMSTDRGALTCEAKGQFGVPSTKSVCSGRFPIGQQLTITAELPSGLQAYFGTTGECDPLVADRSRCVFKPRLDYTIDNFTNIVMTARAASVPLPPEPVALSFALGASSPSDGVAAKGEHSLPMLQLRATAANGTAMLQTLTLKAAGSGRDDLDLATVKLVLDANGNGRFDAGETVLAEGRPGADNGEVQLTLGSALAIPATADLLVVADLAADVHGAAAAMAGTGVLLALGILMWPAPRRRAGEVALGFAIFALVMLPALTGCGGGDPEPADETVAEGPPDTPPPAPPVLVTYRLDLTAYTATDTAVPPRALVSPVLVEGATVTVRQ